MNRLCYLTMFLLLVVPLNMVHAQRALRLDATVHVDPQDAMSPVNRLGTTATINYVHAWNSSTPESFSVGFWAKRTGTEITADDAVLFNLPSSGSSEGVVIKANILGDDSSWHYFYMVASPASGDNSSVDVYIDPFTYKDSLGPTTTFPSTHLDYDKRMVIGSKWAPDSVTNAANLCKSGTLQTMLIDDITFISGSDTNIHAFHRGVFREGSGTIGSAVLPGDLVMELHKSFNEASSQQPFSHHIDTTNTILSVISPALQYYVPDWLTTEPGIVFSVYSVETDDRPEETVIAHVSSLYGGDLNISPRAGMRFVARSQPVTFEAPNEIFLDRYKRELSGTAAEIRDKAFYKAVLEGVVIDEQEAELSLGTTTKHITLSLDGPVNLTWIWGLEYAVIVDSATDLFDEMDDSLGLPILNGAEVSSQNRVGKHWVKENTLISAAIDGIVIPGSPVSNPNALERFTVKDYVTENAPQHTARSVILSRTNSIYLDGGLTGISLANTDFTIDFWARMDPVDADSDQNVICIGETNSVGGQVRIGFRRESLGNAFFALDNNGGALAELPPEETDYSWHHWAVSYDHTIGTVSTYRDGQPFGTVTNTLVFAGSTYMTIGAANNGGTPVDIFSGSLDNVRVWNTTRTKTQVRESMATTRYGAVADLALELTFDDPDAAGDFRGSNIDGYPNPVMQVPAVAYPRVEGGELQLWEYTVEARIQLPYDGTLANRALFAGIDGVDFGINSNALYAVELENSHVGGQLPSSGPVREIVVTMVNSQSTASFYTNGVFVGEVSLGDGTGYGIGNPAMLYLGNYAEESMEGGVLDEVRVWGLRSTNQIASNYDAVLTGSEPGLLAYWNFDNGSTADMTGNGHDGVFLGGAGIMVRVRSEIDPTLAFELVNLNNAFPVQVSSEGRFGAMFPEFDLHSEACPILRMETDESVIKDWLRLTWRWQKEWKLSVAVNDSAYLGLPFITPERTGCPNSTIQSTWVPDRDSCTVGTVYRTPDRCYTLSDVQAQQYTFPAITMDTLFDGSNQVGVATRQFFFPQVRGPGSLMFMFDRTIFRAEIPMGEFLDVSSLTNLNLQLTPDLCVGGELQINGGAPPIAFADFDFPDPNSGGSAGPRASVWDPVGERLLPLRPGEFRLDWPDADKPESAYLIHITSHFPSNTVSLSYQRETDLGFRLGDFPDYVTTYEFPVVTDHYPASPLAHYNMIYNVDGDDPPVELNANESDRWFFKELAWATGSVLYNPQEGTLQADASAKALLLYTYKLDPGQVAVGNEAGEAMIARIVQTSPLTTQPDATLSDGNRQVATFDDSANHYLRINPVGNGAEVELIENSTRTLEFWAKRSTTTDNPDLDRIIYEQSGAGALLQVGFHGSDYTNNPNGFFLRESGGGDTLVDFPDVNPDDGWHHWALTTDSGDLRRLYMDGRLLGVSTGTLSHTAADFTSAVIGQSVVGTSGPLGELDNFRIWSRTLSVAELRAAMLTRAPSDSSGLQIDADFDTSLTTQSGASDATLSTLASVPGDLLAFSADAPNEVATRILSKFDTSGLGSGYILKRVSNYNAGLYDRDAGVARWGPIFPVNWAGLFGDFANRLEVAYYDNPYNSIGYELALLHPNVDWPVRALQHGAVDYPTVMEHKDKRIYVASRLGSEGVDSAGGDQPVFDPAIYDGLALYNQPDPTQTGFNPNEEHGFLAPSIKDQLTGDNQFNLGQDAAFALQNGINRTNRISGTYTSDPWVLVQYRDIAADEWLMAAYKVEATRAGAGLFPALDPVTHAPIDTFNQPVAQPSNPMYDFDYPSFAGDVLIPPYPLNLVIGNVAMPENRGGNIQVDGVCQRTVWKDRDLNAWVVSGGGRFFYKYWYPMRADFWYDTDTDKISDLAPGTSVAWLSTNGRFLATQATPNPVSVRCSSYWRSGYPVLKRGETLTYAGGENKAENAADEGLPAILGFASAQIIYDTLTPEMTFDSNSADTYSARVIRPLDRLEYAVAETDMPSYLTPAYTENIMIDGGRWYFKSLTGSLQKRFYYDSLESKLVLRGRVNNLEGGDPDLTKTPITSSIVEPNVLTRSDYRSIVSLADWSSTWTTAAAAIYAQSQNPHNADNVETTTGTNDVPVFYAGVENYDTDELVDVWFYIEEDSDPTGTPGSTISSTIPEYDNIYQPVNSLGAGAALIPHASILSDTNMAPLYVTVVENNHPDAGGAVSLHIIRIGDERYRGSIKVVEAQNVFDEKINLRHTGDFGGNSEDVYYQWWVRDVASLDTIGLPTEDIGWQVYEEGLGLHQIEFAGRPDIMLADKFFYVRYGEKDELVAYGGGNLITNDLSSAVTVDSSWRLVDINSTTDTYSRVVGGAVPFQWAGALNSPQLQADGSKRYIPQLVMGWVKRVLDRINPYEARYSDFYNNESPATYSSMLQIAGKPYNGAVALNSDKDVIEGVGLIELYETVLARARELTLDIPGASTEGTDQALLLAATRLAMLYDLLAREAYSDAQNPLVRITDENGLGSVASHVHAFQNQEASLLHEELALLRGTDFLKAYPAFNRLFWNYVKGLGEAAYNANYNIYDVNVDGFINEFDAAELFPQGHGDAWGHFLAANKMHYELLRNNAFDWNARAEFYSLLDNVIEADYLDEKSFARIAAAKARTGAEIVRGTYRLAYVEDPDGQWQGYGDADAARAWGVSEWGKRAGHGAVYDWMVGNAIVPEYADDVTTNTVENLDQIDRRANRNELAEIASVAVQIQQTLDEANRGSNPLGLDQDALAFDLDPQPLDGDPVRRETHFDQIYGRTLLAANNATAAFAVAARAENQLQRIADDTLSIQAETLRQDLSFRNRLIEIFGTPYGDKIGPGQVFPEGYSGPDTLLYLYVDRTATTDLIPASDPRYTAPFSILNVNEDYAYLAQIYHNVDWSFSYDGLEAEVGDFFKGYFLSESFAGLDMDHTVPVGLTSNYGFQVPDADNDNVPDWGTRAAYGRIQMILNEMIVEELAYEDSISDYGTFLQELMVMNKHLLWELGIEQAKEDSRSASAGAIITLEVVERVAGAVADYAATAYDVALDVAEAAQEFLPTSIGFSTDAAAPARGAIKTVGAGFAIPSLLVWAGAEVSERVADASISLAEALAELDETRFEELREMSALVSEIGEKVASEEGFRLAIGKRKQRMRLLALELASAKAEGFRLLEEREAFNMSVAASVQRNRYQDMMLRITRNDSMSRYQNAFENAARYTWLAAKAYDYETSLSAGHPANPRSLLEEIVKTRTLGNWADGVPAIGEGGLASILARLKANFDTLDAQLGINNPQLETGRLSLRHEHFRIGSDSFDSDESWREALRGAWKDDLWALPEYRKYCRPISSPEDGPVPGLVIEFRTEINQGRNVFGRTLGGGDHAYSLANFATKIRSVGAWFEDYSETELSLTPRAYLVPAGLDVIRSSDAQSPELRTWDVIEQAIPVPYVLNSADLTDPNYIPSIHSLNGSFADIRRFGDFRVYHTAGGTAIDPDQMSTTSRLIGRSIWNTRWLLIIPASTFHSDPTVGLNRFIGNADSPGVSDIKLVFETYSHEGL